jgi:hypothetical protein
MSDADPLADADVGETVTIEHTEEIWLGQLEADHASGSDRFGDRRVSNVEVVEDEYGDQHLAVTVESDVTKRLPRRWDTARDPRTDSERRQARRDRWARTLARLLPVPVTLGIGLAVTDRLMRRLAPRLTINGEPLGYSPTDLVPIALLVLVVFLAVLVIPAMRGEFRGGSL